MPTFSTENQPETRGAGGQKQHKIIRDALMLALNREVQGENGPTKRINQIAEAICKKAGEMGDIPAAKEVFDRVDGKAVQAVEHSGPDGEAIQISDTEAARRIAALLVGATK
jgi:hypothetical protein